MRKERKHYTAEEKVAVLRRHLLDKVPVSDLCEELALQPTVFYRWQKEFFENGAAAFQTPERPRRQAEEKQKRIEFLEKKVQTKDEVLAELMAEHIILGFHLTVTLRRSVTQATLESDIRKTLSHELAKIPGARLVTVTLAPQQRMPIAWVVV